MIFKKLKNTNHAIHKLSIIEEDLKLLRRYLVQRDENS